MKRVKSDLFDSPIDKALFLPREFQEGPGEDREFNASEERGASSSLIDILSRADGHARIDLAARARPLRDHEDTSDAPEFETEGEASAKPAHAGGKGRGKDKADPLPEEDTPVDEPVSQPDPAPEPQPEPAPEPTSGTNGFNIDVEFYGNWTSAYKTVLFEVIDQVESIIIGDLPDVNGIDDFKLWAGIDSIDGSGGVWAKGNSIYERAGSNLSYEGWIKLDEADVAGNYAAGNLDDVMFHEILHSLGFGTTWKDMGLVADVGGKTRFTGEAATKLYNTEFATVAAGDAGSEFGVPLSRDDAHWNHGDFSKEVMTTSLYGSGNYVSNMTVAALHDMGYETAMSDEFAFV